MDEITTPECGANMMVGQLTRCEPEDIASRLRARKLQLQEQLDEVDMAISLVEGQPEVIKLIDTVKKALRHGC